MPTLRPSTGGFTLLISESVGYFSSKLAIFVLKWKLYECRYRNAELQNGRWAMLGVAGMLIPDVSRYPFLSAEEIDLK